MDLANSYCIYAGTTRGILQCSYCKPDEKITYSVPEEQSEITALEWGRSDDEIIIGYKNEQVHLFDTFENKYKKSILKLEGEGPIVGVAPIDTSILIAKQDGIVTIWFGKKSDYFSINLEEKGTLDAICYNKNRTNIVGTGGEFNDFKLWNLETKQCIFKAKSMGHDELNLPIPTSIRAITGLQESEKLNACATKEGQVLLYDERAQRRPVVKFIEKKASYTCINTVLKDRQCLVGTARGYLQLLDLRAPGKCVKTFTGFTGSVTSVVCDINGPYVATSSLDRYLRIFNVDTKELVFKGYLKQSLTKILMKPIIKEEPVEEINEGDSGPVDEEYEEIFNNMETVTDDKKGSKRKLGQSNKKKKKNK